MPNSVITLVMIPSPNDLNYFIEVANVLNLSRAAESLGISQPSLTLAMQRLETAVGTMILIRHKRGVTLTKAGKHLLAHARHLIEHWDNLKTQALSTVNDIQGCFTIGCHPSVAMYSLPLFLADLLEKHPRLEVKLQHDISRRITDQVINLNIDIGIVVNPIKHPDVVIKKLDDDKVTLWRSGDARTIQDLDSEDTVILCDPSLIQTQTLLKALRKQMSNVRLVECGNLEVIAKLTQHGCGIGILPKKIALAYALDPLPKAPVYHDEICVLYRGENRDIQAVKVIIEAIKGAFKN